MKKLLIPGILIIFQSLLNPSLLLAQEQELHYGFTPNDWININKRWEDLKPKIEVFMNNGDTITGQLAYVKDNQIVVFTGYGLLLDNIDTSCLIDIPLDTIKYILYNKGGSKHIWMIAGAISLGVAGSLGGLTLYGGWSYIPGIVLGGLGTGGGALIGNKIQKSSKTETIYPGEKSVLKESAILSGKMDLPNNIDLLLASSRAVRKVFPDKHLRISFGMSIGPDMVNKGLTDMIESTSLPEITEYRYGPIAFEFFDISWRFNDRLILGGQIYLNRGDYTYLFYSEYHYNNPPVKNISYNYNIQFFESRIYCEYAIKPITRFFTKKHELLLGVGILTSHPYIDIDYAYVPDGNIEYIGNKSDKTVSGVQARSSFHYYPYPGFSLFAGVEANFYKGLTIQEINLPTATPGISINIPSHKLNFSTVRLKIGTSIYF